MTLNFRHASEVWKSAVHEMSNPIEGVMMPWWPRFTEILGGLRPRELTLLCAPTGAGKTQWLANLSAQLLIQRVPHFVAPVETGDSDFLIRVISALERKDYNTGERFTAEELEAATARQAKLIVDGPLYISTHDNRVEIEEMVNTIKFMVQEHGVRVAMLDNLNFFLKITSAQMEKAEMDNAMHEFVMLVKKIPVHTILIVHPRKTDGGRVESEFDLKGSSTAVQEASNVLLFNRPKPEDVESRKHPVTDREAVFRKIRKRGHNIHKPVWFAYQSGRLGEYQR